MASGKDDLYKKQLELIGRGVRAHFDGTHTDGLTPEMEALLRRLKERERAIDREIAANRARKK